jgi:SAM-dependent methyltransferase
MGENSRTMPSEVRLKIFESMEEYRKWLDPDNKGWKVLEVGIDGDTKPGGNFQYFGKGNIYKTLDYLPRLYPDYVADITDTKMPEKEWDLIICSQVLEHVFEYSKAISEIFRMLKKGGYAILDCPWNYPYHGQDGYDDYWRISHIALRRLMEEAGFEIMECRLCDQLVTGLGRRPL